MFRKARPQADPIEQGTSYDTVLGAGARIDGDLTVRGAARILGEVDGSLEIAGDLEVELGAAVRGDVRAERARIAGRIAGDITVKDSLELKAGAHLRGDVYAASFRIQDGAVFQGQCHMGKEAVPAARREGAPAGSQ